MSPNEILDEVLKFIYTSDEMRLEYNQVGHSLEDVHTKLLGSSLKNYLDAVDESGFCGTKGLYEVKEILEKLDSDGYVKQVPGYIFHTTFKGRWFIQQGAYTKAYESERLLAQSRKLDTRLLLF